jgi:membrane protease YdiL (CAAX protease family)
MLAWETRLVMLAFLFPAIASAVIVFAAHTAGVVDVTRFPTFVPHNPVLNLILGVVSYLSVGAVVPLALFMLARTGQPPYMLGLGRPRFTKDLAPGLGLAVAAFAVEVFMIIPFATLIKDHPGLFNTVSVGHVPAYYVIWGIAISATTAVAEEVMMTGYFLTRLEQLGWSPNASLLVSLTLRTSYHVYYGLGFVLTIPLGYFVTKSYQKHHRLNRSIAAHFLYDAVLVTVSILR